MEKEKETHKHTESPLFYVTTIAPWIVGKKNEERQKNKESERQRFRKTKIQKDKDSEGRRFRKTKSQRDRYRDRDQQTETQIKRETERKRDKDKAREPSFLCHNTWESKVELMN